MDPQIDTPAALPPYTYVPGRAPHPVNDPAGHLFGRAPHAPQPLDVEHPELSPEWRRAIELFNAGFYWEAHEEWESLWHAAGRRGAVADLLKGLIKLAAAGVKAYEGRPVGVQRHALRAAELFALARESAGTERLAGLDMSALLHRAQHMAQSFESVSRLPASPPCPGLLGRLEPAAATG